MAIKKYFIDNEMYGVDAMNKIVSSLRTTGIDGEFEDCLKVTKATGLSVHIAPGRGWVDGCQIELDATEIRAVSAEAGIYSVIMQLSKTGTQTDNIDIVVLPGKETGAHVIAYATVSENTISDIADVRVQSKFNGRTADPNPAGIADWEPGSFLLFSDYIGEYYKIEDDGAYRELVQYMTLNSGELNMEITFYPVHWRNDNNTESSTPDTFAGRIKIYVDGKQQESEIIRKGKKLHSATFRLNVTAGSVISIWGNTDVESRYSLLGQRIFISSVKFYIGRRADAIARL